MKKYRCPTCAHPSLFPPSIRADYEAGATCPQIAHRFRATPQGVRVALIKLGARIRPPVPGRKPKAKRNEAIRAALAAGVTRSHLAQIHGVTPTRISFIGKNLPSQAAQHKAVTNNRNTKRK